MSRLLVPLRAKLTGTIKTICISLYASDRTEEVPRLYRLVIPRAKLTDVTTLPDASLQPPYEGEYAYITSIQEIIQKSR